MLQAHDGCRQVYYRKLPVDDLLNADSIVTLCVRILCRVTVVDTVDGFCKQDAVCVHFDRTQGNAGIGREIRMSGTACKEDYLALLKIAVSLIFREKLRYRAAYKRGQDLGLHACVAENL